MEAEHAPPVAPGTRPDLPFERHVSVLDAAARTLARLAATMDVRAAVPTCSRWTMADLVAHQGMVHRWAASNLRRDAETVPTKDTVLRQVPAHRLVEWFQAGAAELLATLGAVDPDVPAMVFLHDHPRPREFWARRQAHETTIHAADALAGALGRMPTADEVGVDLDIALDGIDELLTGFFPRGRSRLADGTPFTVAVRPTDSDRGWTMHVSEKRLVTLRRRDLADATFSGTAAQLYLGLWNRGAEITATGRIGVLERWRAVQRVRW